MRILHVIQTLDPAAGGPPMIAFRLAAASAGLGHEVSIAVEREGPTEAVEAALATVPHGDRVRRYEVGRVSPAALVARTGSRRMLGELIANVDAVHLHGVWEPILCAAGAEARRQRRPYFILLNGMLDPWSLSQSAAKKRLALAMGYRRMLDRAAGLHLGNVDEQELVARLHLRTPGYVIPNGVFLEEIEPLPRPGEFRESLPELGDDPFVLFLSRLHYKKGLDYLGEAFAKLAPMVPGARLVVAGPDGGAREAFEKHVRDAGLASRVHVVGPIYGRRKLAALVDASCFCLPSRQEGFSMAITEALACGSPAVISDACHFPEVERAGAGRVLPLEPRRFADAMADVLRDPTLRRRMSEAGRALIRSAYTWPLIAEKTIAMYRAAGARG